MNSVPIKQYGKLTPIKVVGHAANRSRIWQCRCDCGSLTEVRIDHLRKGTVASCGCSRQEKKATHGHNRREQRSRTYSIWAGMIQRCTNPKHDKFAHYGGRGITIDASWFEFENFLADMGECPDGLTLERVENNQGYSKMNCKWATRTEQANNTRRTA